MITIQFLAILPKNLSVDKVHKFLEQETNQLLPEISVNIPQNSDTRAIIIKNVKISDSKQLNLIINAFVGRYPTANLLATKETKNIFDFFSRKREKSEEILNVNDLSNDDLAKQTLRELIRVRKMAASQRRQDIVYLIIAVIASILGTYFLS